MAPKSPKLPTPKKVWKTTLASSPGVTVHGGAVYAYVFAKSQFAFAALEPATGKPRWLGPGVPNLVAGATAATDAHVVVREHAPYGPKLLRVLDAATGLERHTIACTDDPADAHQPAFVAGPFLHGTLAWVVTARHGHGPALVSFDLADGAKARVVSLGHDGAPIAAQYDGSRILVTTRDATSGGDAAAWSARILAIDATTGAALWRAGASLVAHTAAQGVVIADARASRTTAQHTALEDDSPSDLVALDAATGAERWRRTMRGGFFPIVLADRIVAVDHHTDAAVALDLETGAVMWSLGGPHPPPAGSSAPIGRSWTARDGEIWLTGSRDRIVGLGVASGSFRSTSFKGYRLASDAERLYVADSSSLTACTFG